MQNAGKMTIGKTRPPFIVRDIPNGFPQTLFPDYWKFKKKFGQTIF